MEQPLPKESSESEAENESENVISVISIKNKSCCVVAVVVSAIIYVHHSAKGMRYFE